MHVNKRKKRGIHLTRVEWQRRRRFFPRSIPGDNCWPFEQRSDADTKPKKSIPYLGEHVFCVFAVWHALANKAECKIDPPLFLFMCDDRTCIQKYFLTSLLAVTTQLICGRYSVRNWFCPMTPKQGGVFFINTMLFPRPHLTKQPHPVFCVGGWHVRLEKKSSRKLARDKGRKL